MSALKTRTLIGISLVALVIGVFAVDAGFGVRLAVPALIVTLGLAGFLEYARMARLLEKGTAGGRLMTGLGLLATLYHLGLAWWLGAGESSPAEGGLVVAGLAGFLCAAFVSLIAREDFLDVFSAVLASLLGVLLFGLLFSFALRVYLMDDARTGLWRGVVFFLGVKGNDIAAYLVGTAWGRHHFLRVSPGKTVEGSLAAIIFSAAWFYGAACWSEEFFFEWPLGILFGIILSLASQLGDLTESVLKRFHRVKDSASLLPEFGGVLDLIDSFLYSGFLFWCLLELRP